MTKPAYTLVAQLVTLMMMLSLYGDRKQISAMIRTGRSICAQYCWNHRDNVQLYLSMKGCDELFRLIKTGVKTVSASLQRHLLLCTLPVSDFHFYHTQLRSRVFAKFHTEEVFSDFDAFSILSSSHTHQSDSCSVLQSLHFRMCTNWGCYRSAESDSTETELQRSS